MVAVPFVGFLFAPLRRTARAWRAVGNVDAFERGKTVRVSFEQPDHDAWAALAAQGAAYVRRNEDDSFVAFSVHCTHTGCPVAWNDAARLFFCPCHGGTFAADGTVAGGPPPRPLDRHPVRIEGGNVEIATIPLPHGRRDTR
jgi:menaquinol-cytochrome c reductase iron-sulfur subunit